MEKIYLVLREKGTHTDNKTYYESETTICGVREDPSEASDLLKDVVKKYHPDETAIRGTYDMDTKLDTSMTFWMEDGLEDSFWIKTMLIGPEGDEY